MPRVLTSLETVERRRNMPPDHPRHIVAAWRDGRRDRWPATRDPWLWDDHPATLAAYEAGRNGEPRPVISVTHHLPEG